MTRIPRWAKATIAVVGALVLAVLAVLIARLLRDTAPIAAFIEEYHGQSALPESAPVGFPAWLAWQHFLNAFFLVLIVRTGLLVRTTRRPVAYWTRSNSGLVRTKRPPKRITLELWLHLALDVVWLVNGIVFVVALIVTGQWMRIVPTSWDIFPHAASTAIQYLSLDWPLENGWVNYNALQVLAYFTTVFLAAPLAFITGVRMSGAWPDWPRLNRFYPIELARRIHFPVMLYFVGFTIVHVTLVLATGALRNLNHMYGARDDSSWVGFAFFAGSIVLMVGGWFLAKPLLFRRVAALTGKVSR